MWYHPTMCSRARGRQEEEQNWKRKMFRYNLQIRFIKQEYMKTVMDYLYCSINKWSPHTISSHTIDFSEHGVHIFQVVVVEKPHTWLSLILVKRNYRKTREKFFNFSRIRFW